jgi:hypothetical protein
MRSSRSTFLASAAGAAVALAGSNPTRAAWDDDLALLRLSAAAQLTLAAYYGRLLSWTRLDGRERRGFRAARAACGSPYARLERVIGADAPTSADLNVSFSRRTFADRHRALALGVELERVGAAFAEYAAARVVDGEARALVATLAASHGVRLGGLTALDPRIALRADAPRAVDDEAATASLQRYWR